MTDRCMDPTKRDRLKQLRSFCHAARWGSITRAAEHVFSSQPSVSVQIRALESYLGVTLFTRAGPRVSLTPEGRTLFRRALPLVQGVDQLPDTFNEQYRQIARTLYIGAGEAAAIFLLPPILKAYVERVNGGEKPDQRAEQNTATTVVGVRWSEGVGIGLGAVGAGSAGRA